MTNRFYSVFVPLILAFSVSAILISAQQAALDAAQRQQVIQAVIANLKQHYVYPDRAQTAADALLAHERSGDYRRAADSAALAGLLTRDLRAASQDNHLEVVYIPAVRRQALPDFGMGIPTSKPINPYSDPDWAAVGVEPDIKVKATDALANAEKLLQQKLREK